MTTCGGQYNDLIAEGHDAGVDGIIFENLWIGRPFAERRNIDDANDLVAIVTECLYPLRFDVFIVPCASRSIGFRCLSHYRRE